ncbi:MAG TPA: protein-L-isoaspartate O-methyltransferase [Candidatus Moranbacteria bacterium]|nr:protein-L-isoaspartate O-methyltransferase [Candidatus Moranbacteria bacterium]
MSKLVNDLMRKGYLKNDLIIDAFSEINRIEFVPKELELEAEDDVALPIGFGQTISQPLVVAFMMELLEPQRGQNILDVGTGSGWTTALLAYIAGKDGKVIGIERIKELKEFGEKNVQKFNFIEKGIVEFYEAEGSKGFPEKAPFDRILVSAVSYEVPQALKDQLKIGGKLVMPIRNSIVYVEKKGETEFYKEEFPGFYFVPLIID